MMGKSRDLRLWVSACHHIGAKACKLSLLKEHIQLAIKNKWKAVLLGDLVNNGVSAGSTHVGLEFGDSMDPMSQAELAVDVFMPLAKAGLLEAVVGGNHAYRSVRAVGLHPEKFIAMMLSIAAANGGKPPSIMPGIIQTVHELALYSKESSRGGSYYHRAVDLQERLSRMVRQVNPGTEERWLVPFYPGLGTKVVNGVPLAFHHGTHNKSRDNWNRLQRAARGHRIYLTAHNHRMGWEPGLEDDRGKDMPTDYFSAGTYQDYEEYASIAMYPRTPTGSVLIEYSAKNDTARGEMVC